MPDSEDSSVLDKFCDSFRNVAGARITLMDRDGKVVGESDTDTAEVGIKLDRPEVQEALQKGEGSSIRFSKTLRIDMLYTAFFSKEKDKIIRLALPMTKVRVFQNEVMILFSFGLFLRRSLQSLSCSFLRSTQSLKEKKRLSNQLRNPGNISRPAFHAH